MRIAVLDAAGLRPERLLLADQILMFDMPFVATRTASKRTFLYGWCWWCRDGRKALKNDPADWLLSERDGVFCASV
jgi:hypothetical protein